MTKTNHQPSATYTERKNAVRAAKVAMIKAGVKGPLSDVHFKIVDLDDGLFGWERIDLETGARSFSPPEDTNRAIVAEAKEEDRLARHGIKAGRKVTGLASNGVEKVDVAALPPAKALKPPKADKPLGKRAEALAAASRGKMPAAPDFSKPTHKAYRKKLDEVVALVKAKDVAALKAVAIRTSGSSGKALDRFRQMAVAALEAKGAAQ